MAFIHGKNTALWFGSKNLSSYFNSAELTVETDSSDTTTFSATWRTGLTGTMGAKASFGGLYDPTITDLTATLGGEFGYVLTYAPGGAAAIGDRARLLSADVTGGAFTAATTATSQRLLSATSTTALRRYVRYVATRTGGAGGDGITFGLAYSRNF
jgi:hypothetical protein